MDQKLRRAENLVWLGLIITTVLLALAGATAALRMKRHTATGKLPVLGQVADFSLTNQEGQVFSLERLRGVVWVADIIFTRCPGPCPRMTKQMKALQDALPASSPVKLVTLTTDPKFDTPPVLKAYAQRYGADLGRWVFLTGTPREIAQLASGSLKLAAVEKNPAEQESPDDLYIHSTLFVLVDRQARLRGIFETTGEGVEPDAVQAQMLSAIDSLQRER